MATHTVAIDFNEDNQANYVGIRPGYTGQQITGYEVAIGAAAVIYTVPAGKQLLIFTTYLTGYNIGAANGLIELSLYDAGPVLRFSIHKMVTLNNGIAVPIFVSRFSPLEIPAGYGIYSRSNLALCYAYGGFEGILVDA